MMSQLHPRAETEMLVFGEFLFDSIAVDGLL